MIIRAHEGENKYQILKILQDKNKKITNWTVNRSFNILEECGFIRLELDNEGRYGDEKRVYIDW